jgi:hypothetical protein
MPTLPEFLTTLPVCSGGGHELLPWNGKTIPACAQDAWLPLVLVTWALWVLISSTCLKSRRSLGGSFSSDRPLGASLSAAAHLVLAAVLAALHATLLTLGVRHALINDAGGYGLDLAWLVASVLLCVSWLLTFASLVRGAGECRSPVFLNPLSPSPPMN